MLAPYSRGGKIGLFGGAGVGKTVEPLATKELRVVVGANKEDVIQHLNQISPSAKTIYQEVRGGTGHAVKLALAGYNSSGTVLICAGDTPLLTSATLRELLKDHGSTGASATVLSANMPDPSGYGRVLREANGDLAEIVEEKDATEIQKQTSEINSGVYIFAATDLTAALGKIGKNNAQQEEYLTDVIGMWVVNTVALAPVEPWSLSNSLSVALVSSGVSPAQINTVPDEL